MDGGEKKEPALIADCCWWKAVCPSVDLLMKGKQRHAFPSLALISPLSRGPLWTHIGGGWMEGNAPQTERRRRGTKGKQKGRVGGYLFLLCCCQCVSVKIIWTSVNEAQICGCFDFRVYMHTFIYIYISTVNMFMKQPGTVVWLIICWNTVLVAWLPSSSIANYIACSCLTSASMIHYSTSPSPTPSAPVTPPSFFFFIFLKSSLQLFWKVWPFSFFYTLS